MADDASAAGSNETEVSSVLPFALSPALATDDVIDYTSKAGATIWREATTKISQSTSFVDAKVEEIQKFHASYKIGAVHHAWRTEGDSEK